jgi:hypothetical protein
MRRLFALALCLVPALAAAQPAPAPPSPAEQQQLQALSAALGQCHQAIARRDAHGALSPTQIADRAMAACAPREAPIRALIARRIGAPHAAQVMTNQRQHWREAIGRMVVQLRGVH